MYMVHYIYALRVRCIALDFHAIPSPLYIYVQSLNKLGLSPEGLFFFIEAISSAIGAAGGDDRKTKTIQQNGRAAPRCRVLADPPECTSHRCKVVVQQI